MVQVLPYVPSFGEKLAPILAEAGTEIGKGFKQRGALKNLQRLMQPAESFKTQTGAQQPVAGQSPLEQMLNKPGGPSLPEALSIQQLFESALPGSGAVVANYALNQQKLAQKEKADIAKEERSLLLETNKKYYEDIAESRSTLDERELANKAIINSIKSGEVGVLSKANIGRFLTSLGAPEEVRKAMETPGSKEFTSASKTFLSSAMKKTFKGASNERQISIAEQIGAELGVSENANLASALFQSVTVNIDKERIRLTEELLESGVAPSKVPATVDKMMKPFIKKENEDYFEAINTLGYKSGKQ